MLVVWHMQSHHCIKSFEDLALLHNIGCVIPGSNSFVFYFIFFFFPTPSPKQPQCLDLLLSSLTLRRERTSRRPPPPRRTTSPPRRTSRPRRREAAKPARWLLEKKKGATGCKRGWRKGKVLFYPCEPLEVQMCVFFKNVFFFCVKCENKPLCWA